MVTCTPSAYPLLIRWQFFIAIEPNVLRDMVTSWSADDGSGLADRLDLRSIRLSAFYPLIRNSLTASTNPLGLSV